MTKQPDPQPYRLVPETFSVLHHPAEVVIPGKPADWISRRLVATAKHHGGLAVAAPQVGFGVRLVATAEGVRFANPTIVEREGSQVSAEGCLSFPGRSWEVERARRIIVEGIDPLDGRITRFWCDGLPAAMWQHEIDHLDGLVLDGRFPELARART